ncbi:S-phase kinase-associated protein 2 [Schistocerca cancellata]|uniref:S-phase kinase-associated protein 2 n=1 Tax=Schistocerca cancellata TaxID=274614 RepID=UPI0021199CE4|nr:S-phase kinase-associated protein 2 [Schistocerca cancellata]
MKQNRRTRASCNGNLHENLVDITNEAHIVERARVKRRKTCTGNVSQNSSSSVNETWSAINSMGHDILEEMGVGELTEDPSSDSTQAPKSNKRSTDNAVSGGQSTVQENSSEVPAHSKKVCTMDEVKADDDGAISSDFFLYRRARSSAIQGEDMFNKLSDEMVLMVFRWLPKKTLALTARVCKRWKRISLDEALWTRIDLGSRVLQPGSMEHIMKRGVLILRLSQAVIPDPVFLSSSPLTEECRLQYLDLSMASVSEKGMAQLLSACHLLRKLSLENCFLNADCCAAIGENSGLEVLNMSGCEGVNERGITSIITGCSRLSSLNLAWTNLSKGALEMLCSKVPKSLQRLNISGCKKTMEDKNVEQLVNRCPDLVELDLSDCINLTDATLTAVCQLSKIEYVACSRCYGITPAGYYQLASVTSLAYLDIFNLFQKPALAAIQLKLPNVEINKFLFSSVARPTVGIRRTSIWGLRVRD